MNKLLLALAMIVAATSAQACEVITHKAQRYTVCSTDDADKIGLWLYDETGRPFGDFAPLAKSLDAIGKRLVFATNGGMYHSDRRPVGHFLADATEIQGLITSDGPGNFGLLPNGVFCVTATGRAEIYETLRFRDAAPQCRIATQSGPLLVERGKLHPAFLPESTSLKRRNGVGVTRAGVVHFAISEGLVRFHDFATLFRDRLDSPDALFLDGSISRLYAPEIDRADKGPLMGPILGVTEAQ